MAATLKSLGEERDVTRRIAVLGPMRELGDQSEELHVGLLEAIIAARVDRLILIGEEMATLAAALTWRGGVERAATADDAGQLLFADLRAGDAVLVKASNAVGLARLVERMVKDLPCSM